MGNGEADGKDSYGAVHLDAFCAAAVKILNGVLFLLDVSPISVLHFF